MSQYEAGGKPPGPLARVGQNDAFAGFTRIGIVVLGVVLTGISGWAASDLKGVLSDIKDNQAAVISLGLRTQHLEDSQTNSAAAMREFREWTVGQVTGINNQINADSQRLNEIDRSQGKALSRILCLENHVRCPQP